MSDIDLVDKMLKENPKFMQYRLRKNFCASCKEYSNGDICKERGCKQRKKPHCIPQDNNLGWFDRESDHGTWTERGTTEHLDSFKPAKETVCFYWLAKYKIEERIDILGTRLLSNIVLTVRHVEIVKNCELRSHSYDMNRTVWLSSHKERATEVFKRHGSKFTDIIYPICKTRRSITSYDWISMVSP